MFFSFLKQRGFLDLHTTIGSQTLEPLAATNNATVHRFLLCFPPLSFFPFSTSPICGSALKNNPSHPYLAHSQVNNLLQVLEVFPYFWKSFHRCFDRCYGYVTGLP